MLKSGCNGTDIPTSHPLSTSDAENEQDNVDVDYQPPHREADEDPCSSAESSQGESSGDESELEGIKAVVKSEDQADDIVVASVDDCQPNGSEEATHATTEPGDDDGEEEAASDALRSDVGGLAQREASTRHEAVASSPTSRKNDGEPGKAVRRSGRSKH